MHYKANWLLIVDNLSDFAHLAFVHTNTLGGSEEYAYKTKPVAIEKLDDGFRVERWHMSADPPPYHCKVIANKTDKIDRRNIGRMIIPGHLPARHDVCAGGPGRGEGRSGAGHAAISQRAVHDAGDAQLHAFLLELSARFRRRQPEHRAVAAATASKRPSTRTGRSSRRSRRCSMPIRTISCSPSARTRALTYFRWLMARRIEAEGSAARAA